MMTLDGYARFLAVLAVLATAWSVLLSTDSRMAVAQSVQQPVSIHLRVDDVSAITRDRLEVAAAGFAVLRTGATAEVPDAAVRDWLRSRLEEGLGLAMQEAPFLGTRAELMAASAALREHMDAAAAELGLHVVVHGISGLEPSSDVLRLIADRLTAEEIRLELQYRADAERITAEAALEVARIEAAAAYDAEQIVAQGIAEADRIRASAAAANTALYEFWSSRLLAADLAGPIAIADENPFASLDALLAACLAPFAEPSAPDGVASPQANRPHSAKPPIHPWPKENVWETAPRIISQTVTAMTADGIPVDAPVTVSYRTQEDPSPEFLMDRGATETLVRDVVAAEILPLVRDLELVVANQERAALAEQLMAAVAEVLGDIGDGVRVESAYVSGLAVPNGLGASVFDRQEGGAMLAAAEQAADALIAEATTAAEAHLDDARQARQQVERAAELEVMEFSSFVDRYRAAPEVVARLFCLSLIAGETDG